ncbi:transcription factor subunit Med10 of mediator complex-domain-containing protein [Syncephalis plumigaleata]|nr:transcription factor subunit Med10 of mediator complex-domain-containing protein [Syncephalis plumigaleata]
MASSNGVFMSDSTRSSDDLTTANTNTNTRTTDNVDYTLDTLNMSQMSEQPATTAAEHEQWQQQQEELRVQLESRLGETINSLFTIGLGVYDFQTGTDGLLQKRVNELVTQYRDLTELGSNLQIAVPEEVVRYVEDGRNPDLFSREFAERTVAENQFAHGRMMAFDVNFWTTTVEELGQVLPDSVMHTYSQQISYHKESNRDLHGTSVSSNSTAATSATAGDHSSSNNTDGNNITNQGSYPHT